MAKERRRRRTVAPNVKERIRARLPFGWSNAMRRAADAASMTQAAWLANVLHRAFLPDDQEHLAPVLVDPNHCLPAAAPHAVAELCRRLGVQMVGSGDGSHHHPLEVRVLAPPRKVWACNGLAAIWAAQPTKMKADKFWRLVLESLRQGLVDETHRTPAHEKADQE